MTISEPVEWGRDRLGELVELWEAAMPEEQLLVDDLEGITFAPDVTDPDGPFGTSVVMGTPGGDAGVVVSLRRPPGLAPVAYVQLLVVHPARRRRGLARSLLGAAEAWARERGAVAMQAGGAAPLYLYTGVDSNWLDAVCCFEASGYTRTAVELDMFCSPRGNGRVRTPPGVRIEAVGDDAAAVELAEWTERRWPWWSAEFARAAAAGTVVLARSAEDSRVVGAAAHSVGRMGVVGPVAVDPWHFGGGVGAALMSVVLEQLAVAGLSRVEIAWVSTVRFYVRSCGARIGRASQVLRKELPAAVAG